VRGGIEDRDIKDAKDTRDDRLLVLLFENSVTYSAFWFWFSCSFS